MNRGNMGKQISNAPKSKSKKVKKMFGGGMASMPMPGGMPGSAVRPPMPAPGGAAANFGSALRQLGAPKVGASGATRNMANPGSAAAQMVAAQGAARNMANPIPAGAVRQLRGMAKGGKVTRADGCCMKGHTKGTMK